jgi:hypothetical protein
MTAAGLSSKGALARAIGAAPVRRTAGWRSQQEVIGPGIVGRII